MPGMGGFCDSVNFIKNCSEWNLLERQLEEADPAGYAELQHAPLPSLRLAPITGAVENIGFPTEKDFYRQMLKAAWNAGCNLSIGDGCPDEKLQYGIEAVRQLQSDFSVNTGNSSHPTGADVKAAVFMKPYPQDRFLERMEWSSPVAEYLGIDIDSYNIVTMRNLVKLERKTATQLLELKARAGKLGLPFAVKGVFTSTDIALMQEVMPDVIVVSNHGGRVENRIGSTAMFLAENASALRNCCGSLWVDGGIRKRLDLQTAAFYGASQVMIGRPLITALCKGGDEAVKTTVQHVQK